MTLYLFLDESKAKRFLIVTATLQAAQVAAVRKEITALILPGQRSVHMRAESDRRRHKIASIITGLTRSELNATVYDASAIPGTDLVRRSRCIGEVISDVASTCAPTRLVLDMDETLVNFDRQRLIEAIRSVGAGNRISYVHTRLAHEPVLSLPDAIAWCWARGGTWRRRIAPAVTRVCRLR